VAMAIDWMKMILEAFVLAEKDCETWNHFCYRLALGKLVGFF
jgi:hypothetical protein